MQYLIIIFCSLILTSCFRIPLNVYSPAPVNTVAVKENGDAGINASYFSNGPAHPGEKNLASNGFALQGRAVLYDKWFMEGNLSTLKELTNGQFDENLSTAGLTTYKAKTSYNYKEIGIGKIVNLNEKGNNKLLLSTGYGYTTYKNIYDLTTNTKKEVANFNFNNNHLFLNAQFQFDFGVFNYQVGLKTNFVNFRNVTTNNGFYLGKEADVLQNEVVGFKSSVQIFNDFGVYPFKDNKWLSIHAGFSLSNRVYVENRFRSRTLGGNLSLMANPSKFLKKKK